MGFGKTGCSRKGWSLRGTLTLTVLLGLTLGACGDNDDAA
jgi:hypothetical protein